MSGGTLHPVSRSKVKNNGNSPEFEALLSKPICELGLRLEGSPVERYVEQLYRELEGKRLKKFRPAC